MTKISSIEKIKNTPTDVLIVFISTCIAVLGFNIAIFGAILDGIAIFNNAKDLNQGFGLIIIGVSIIAVRIGGIAIAYIISMFSDEVSIKS